MSDDSIALSGLRVQASDEAFATQTETATATALTAGQLLRQAREAQGLHIAALAVKLKVPVKRLEALEADRQQDLPGAVFTRALASSVCRSLNFDPKQVLALLPQVASPALDAVEPGLKAPFKGASSAGTAAFAPSMGRPAVFLVIALMLATLIMVGWPWLTEHVPQMAALTSSRMTQSSAPAPQTVPAVLPAAAETQAPAAEAPMPGSQPAPAPAIAAPMVVATPAATGATAASAAVAAAAATTVSGASSAEILLNAKGTVWIKVQDAQGTVLASKTLYAGDALPVSGAAPLSVVLGKADAVDVMVQGKPLDVLAIARDNVARFEVK